ncbi:MAG: hypothetical protein WCB93_01620 [Gallionella sp.]
MKTGNLLLSAAALFVLLTGTALAEPRNGFSLNAGLSSHTMEDQCSFCISYNSSGLSLGLDYQFALSDKLSINPFLMTSGESTSISGVTASHGILGVQLRYWAGDAFFGGHLGAYSEVLTATSGPLSISSRGSGGGAGLVAGWEKPNGGFYVMGQLDSATLKYSGYADTKLSAFRLSVGYRWK